MKKNSLSSIRREYGSRRLLESNIAADPISQFKLWFDEIVTDEFEPTAMTVATVDASGIPDIRVVLLKDIINGHFVFYTHYDSAKGKELALNPHIALNFFWMKCSRQVRVRGTVQKVSPEMSNVYFASRPRASQISAVVSHQSTIIDNRTLLEEQILSLTQKYGAEKNIPRPEEWGGYAVIPAEIEFWQGRDNRLHDRIRYRKENDQWIIERLSP